MQAHGIVLLSMREHRSLANNLSHEQFLLQDVVSRGMILVFFCGGASVVFYFVAKLSSSVFIPVLFLFFTGHNKIHGLFVGLLE